MVRVLRLGWRLVSGAAIVVVGLSLVTFLLVRVAPGDAAVNVAASRAAGSTTTEQIERIRKELGLDRSLPIQYLQWTAKALRGDLGRSARTNRPVRTELAGRLGTTLQLAGLSSGAALLFGVAGGITAALSRRRSVSGVVRGVALLGVSVPNFWLSYLLILVLAERLRLLPTSGRGGVRTWIMPVVVLALPAASTLSRIVASALRDSLSQPFVTAAQARGSSRWQILRRDAFPHASAAIVSTAGALVGGMFAGTLIAEVVFAWPGVGSYYIAAVGFRDVPAIQASVAVLGIGFVVVSRAADLIHWLVDPRLRRPNNRVVPNPGTTGISVGS